MSAAVRVAFGLRDIRPNFYGVFAVGPRF
jgi:hypothetical protein